MSPADGRPRGSAGTPSFFRSRAGVALLVFLAIAAYFLWTEHQAHVWAAVPYLPWLLLLACPLLHLFMHGGHGGHGDHRGGGNGSGPGGADR
jgi:hypothetical protein